MSRQPRRLRTTRPVPAKWLDPVASTNIEAAVSTLLLVVLGLVGMIWGAAVLSSIAVKGERAEVSVVDAAVAGVRMGSDRMAWSGAWPPEIEQALPRPEWFWLFFAAEALVIALLFWPAWRLLGPRVGDPVSVVIEPTPVNHPRLVRRQDDAELRRQRRGGDPENDGPDDGNGGGGGPDDGPGGGPGDDGPRGGGPGGGGSGRGGGGPGGNPGDAWPTGPPPAPASRKLVVDGPTGDRVILGRAGGDLVAIDDLHSILALGPTGSGKTTSLAIPAVLEWAGPAVVLSTKPDVVTVTRSLRDEQGGRSWLYDPLATAGDDGTAGRVDSWSPLDAIATVPQARNEPELDRRVRQWSQARRSAAALVAGVRRPDELMPETHYPVAEQMLAPLLLAAAAEEVPITTVADWVHRRDDVTVRQSLARIGVEQALAAWDGAHEFDGSTTVGAYQILTSALYAFGEPTVAARANLPGINAQALLGGGSNTLYILAEAGPDARLRPLVTTLLSEIISAAFARAASSAHGRLAEPLLVVLDDAAAAVTPDVIDQLAAAGAGRGIQLLTLTQDLSHLSRWFGTGAARLVADAHRARVVLPGIPDPTTFDYLHGIIEGTRLVDPDGGPHVGPDTDQGGPVSGRSSAAWLRTLSDGTAVLIHANLRPLRMQLRPWYLEDTISQQVNPKKPEPSLAERLRRGLSRSSDVPGLLEGHPSPFDSAANEAEAERYWEAVRSGQGLPDALPFRDESTGGQLATADPISERPAWYQVLWRRFRAWLRRRLRRR